MPTPENTAGSLLGASVVAELFDAVAEEGAAEEGAAEEDAEAGNDVAASPLCTKRQE